MSYDLFLAELDGPNTICIELYQPLMQSYARLAMLKDYHVNFEELFEELVAFAMEECVAEAGLDYYVSYIEDVVMQLETTNAKHDVAIYIPVVEYLGKVIRHIFTKFGMYNDGVANYRILSWATPTTLIFEKYMAFDMTPNHPPGTGLMVKLSSLPEIPADTVMSLDDIIGRYKSMF